MNREFTQSTNVCLVKIDHFRGMARAARVPNRHEFELEMTRKCALRTMAVPASPSDLAVGRSSWTQIGFGPFVATSTSKKVAEFRTVPAIVMSGSDSGGCFSANASRRILTLLR